jgi:DNA-binding CsgD family transcriptional regulator
MAEDDETAEHEYRQSLKYLALEDSDFERARTELAFGQMLRRRRRPTEAREHLRWALHVFQRVDSPTWIKLAAGELRAAGEQDTAASGAGAPQAEAPAADALTPQQLQIARLAAAGGTNREVAIRMSLSPRTVDHHMRNIFSRLGIHSRIELARFFDSGP